MRNQNKGGRIVLKVINSGMNIRVNWNDSVEDPDVSYWIGTVEILHSVTSFLKCVYHLNWSSQFLPLYDEGCVSWIMRYVEYIR